MSFKDHFSPAATGYAAFRPRYPPALFRFLAGLVPVRERAWDCATGNGQAAVGLAGFFTRVVATEASLRQLALASPAPRVCYLACTAEATPLADVSVDLAAVAQAVHWFDLDAFYREARRVLRPHGALAVWTYGRFSVSPEVDRVVERFVSELVGEHWPPERRWVDEGYRSLPFPLERLPAPRLTMQEKWDLDRLMGYLGTWSSVVRYRAARGIDPRREIASEMAAAWGAPWTRRGITWPLSLLAGRFAGSRPPRRGYTRQR